MASTFSYRFTGYALARIDVFAQAFTHQGQQSCGKRDEWQVLDDLVNVACVGMDRSLSHHLSAVYFQLKEVALDVFFGPRFIAKFPRTIGHAVIEMCAVGPSACDRECMEPLRRVVPGQLLQPAHAVGIHDAHIRAARHTNVMARVSLGPCPYLCLVPGGNVRPILEECVLSPKRVNAKATGRIAECNFKKTHRALRFTSAFSRSSISNRIFQKSGFAS